MFEIQGDIKVLDPQKQGEAYPESEENAGDKLFYLESYGCQMNFSDSEIVASILKKEGFDATTKPEDADLILLNTCSIREKAEQTVRNRLKQFTKLKKEKPHILIGMLGCMAERLKEKLLDEEKLVDIVVGPDAYRDLPKLVQEASGGHKAVNTLLSLEETYADISPVRLDSNGVTAFVSIMRGCDNMCSFCVVPFTRGRERSRDPKSLLQEARDLVSKGYKEITLLGQNVDSYLWFGGGPKKDFKKLSQVEKDKSLNFAGLLEKMALVDPSLRIRFSTSHPKDITEEVVHTIARHENICNYIHLPLQSGSSKVLKAMNRTYNREEYMEKVHMIRSIIPDCGISADIITGFCGETEEDHLETLAVMEEVKYDFAYMFMYSERPGTLAQKKFKDDVPEETKKRRLEEIIALQQKHAAERNKADLGKVHKVLVEKTSKRSKLDMFGRNDQNKVVIFPNLRGDIKPGQYLDVKVNECNSATLKGSVLN